MDQVSIGNFIAKKRKEKNMTQVALAERLSVSNKTISKWETGRCMPDYSVIELLCIELNITVAELLDSEDKAENSARLYDNIQILDLIKRVQDLEQQRALLNGIFLVIIGLASLLLHYNIGGSSTKDFFSGILLGLSIVEMLIGIYVIGKGSGRRK